MISTQELRFVLKAKDQASRELRSVGRETGGLGKAMTALKAAAYAAAVVGVALLVKKVVELSTVFDEASDTIRIGTGATGKALENLKKDMDAVLKSVPDDVGKVSQAIADLNTRTGLSGKPLQDLATQLLTLSRITKSDLSSNIRLSTRLFGDWSIAVENQGAALDKLFRVSQSTGITMDSLMSTVVQFGAPLRNLGFSFEESIAMLGRWEKEGVNVETTLTGMRFALKTFASEGIDPQKGLAKAIEDIKKLPKNKALDVGKKIFGLRAFSDVVAAIREGRFDYMETLGVVKNGSDTITKAAADTDGWREALAKLRNKGLVALRPTLEAVDEGLTKVVESLTKWISSKGFKSFMKDLGNGLRDVGQVILDISRNEKFQAFMVAIGGALILVKDAVVWLATELGSHLLPIWDELKLTVQQWGEWLMGPDGGAAWAETLVGTFEAIKAVIVFALDFLEPIIKSFLAFLRGDFDASEQYLKDAWNVLWGAIKGIAKRLGGEVKKVVGGIWDSIKAKARSVWDGIVGVVRGGWNKIRGYINNVIDAVNKVIRWVPGVSDNVETISRISVGASSSNGGTGGSGGNRVSTPALMDNGGTGGIGDRLRGAAGTVGDWARNLMDGLNISWPSSPGGMFGGISGWLTKAVKDAILGLIRTSGGRGQQIIEIAKSMLGVPYLWGGTSPAGFDCSGLIYWAYKQAGIDIPRTGMWNAGRAVDKSSARPGDVMFYSAGGAKQGVRYGHVKMYAGGGQTIESTSGGVQMRPADWAGAGEIRTYLARGGIVSGPRSGYPVMLHGTEKVTPLDGPHARATEQVVNVNVIMPAGTVLAGEVERIGRILAP
ncbi:MAG: NlpC/P60 family protein, partial [Candidatus Omnitrophica bacterium]|nr:NlpC/P60 family protein [Candidatus Omnitrophota bacterium]